MYTTVAQLLTRLNKINPHRGKAGMLIWQIHTLASTLTKDSVDGIIYRLQELYANAYGMKAHRQEIEELLAMAIEIKGKVSE